MKMGSTPRFLVFLTWTTKAFVTFVVDTSSYLNPNRRCFVIFKSPEEVYLSSRRKRVIAMIQ